MQAGVHIETDEKKAAEKRAAGMPSFDLCMRVCVSCVRVRVSCVRVCVCVCVCVVCVCACVVCVSVRKHVCPRNLPSQS
jgi:hypothetical protein